MATKRVSKPEKISWVSMRHHLPLVVIAVLLVLVVLGSAVTYAAVIIPKNTPQNILKTAIKNSAAAAHVSYGATVTAVPTVAGKAKYIATVSGKVDKTAQAAQSNVAITSTDTDLSAEARVVHGQAYVKVGDLTPLATALAPRNADASSLITSVNPIVKNTWISVDQSLLTQAAGNCPITTSGLTKADLQILDAAYTKQPFATIASSSDDKVSGQTAEKFVVSISDAQLANYVADPSLKNISMFKSLAACMKNAMPDHQATMTGDNGYTTFTVWVDTAAHKVVQVASSSNQAMIAKSGYNVRAFVSFNYQPVSIAAPAGATPVLQLLPKLSQTDALQNPYVKKLLGTQGSSLLQLLQQ